MPRKKTEAIRKKGGRPKTLPSPEVVTDGEVDEAPTDTAKTAREEPCPVEADDPPRQDTANTKSKAGRPKTLPSPELVTVW